MIRYNWRIKSLISADNRDDMPGLVGKVYFELTGRDSDTGATQSLHQSCKLEPPKSGQFTPFEQLTEAQVKGWLAKHPNAQRFKDIIARSLAAPEAAAPTPATAGQLPWESVTAPDGGNGG